MNDEAWRRYLDPDEDEPADLSRDDRAGMEAAMGVLRDEPGVWAAPPAALRDRVLSAAAAVEPDPPAEPSGTPVESPRDDRVVVDLAEHRERRSRWRRGLPMAVATVAAAAAIVAGVALWPGGGADPSTFALAGTDLAPAATAEVEVQPLGAGDALTLDVAGLGPAAAGTYYAAWLVGADGTTVPAGSFHLREGGHGIELWTGVGTDELPLLVVTLEDLGSTAMSMDHIVLQGMVAPDVEPIDPMDLPGMDMPGMGEMPADEESDAMDMSEG